VAESQATAVVERTLDLVPESGPDVALWSELLGLPIPQSDGLADLTAEVRQARFFSLVRRCFQAAAARQPLLLVMEGLHWADQASLALIDDLTAHVEQHALFVALAYRPITELSLETLNRPQCMPIAVTALPAADGRLLLRNLVGVDELPVAVEQHLGLRDREGRDSPVNPLFLEESLNVMMGTGILKIERSQESTVRVRIDEELLGRMPVPDTIHGLLLARLDRLQATSRDLLQVASVIGRQFGLESLDIITPSLPRPTLADSLENLTTAEMTRLMTTSPELVYLFRHAMTHEVAYTSLPFARRQALHAAVAGWLEHRHRDNLRPLYPLLAYHFSQAGIHSKGLHFALLAADDARDIYANKEAVGFYNLAEEHLQALGDDQHWEEKLRIILSRGAVFILLGDIAAAMTDAEKALSDPMSRTQPEMLARVYNLMAEAKWRQREYEEAQALAQKVIDDLGHLISSDELAFAYNWHGGAAGARFDFEQALVSLRRAEQICLKNDNNLRLGNVLETISFVYFSQKQLEPALEAMQRSVHLSRDFSTPINVGFALSNIAVIQIDLGLAANAVETLNDAVIIGRDTSDYVLAVSLTNRAAALAYSGVFSDALRDFEEAMNLLDAMDHPQQRAEAYLHWGYAFSSALGDWPDARRRFELARQIIEQRPASYPEEQVRLFIGMAQVEIRDGSPEAGETLLNRAMDLIEEKELAWWRPAVSYFRGLARIKRQDIPASQFWFQQGINAIDEGGSPDYLPLILLELAQLEPAGERRLSLLEQCVAAARKRAGSLDRWRCLRVVGEMLIREEEPGWRRLGEQCLSQAEELAAKIDASAMTSIKR
jgi:predicted ATPase